MNGLNHFLVPFGILYALFHTSLPIVEVIMFSLLFGTLLDAELLLGKFLLKKPAHHLRTWIQEPFGILFLGMPLAIGLSAIKGEYFWLVLIPYTSHVILDYLTIHEVCPLAPFSKKMKEVGIFKAYPAPLWYTSRVKGIPENYVTVISVGMISLLLYLW